MINEMPTDTFNEIMTGLSYDELVTMANTNLRGSQLFKGTVAAKQFWRTRFERLYPENSIDNPRLVFDELNKYSTLNSPCVRFGSVCSVNFTMNARFMQSSRDLILNAIMAGADVSTRFVQEEKYSNSSHMLSRRGLPPLALALTFFPVVDLEHSIIRALVIHGNVQTDARYPLWLQPFEADSPEYETDGVPLPHFIAWSTLSLQTSVDRIKVLTYTARVRQGGVTLNETPLFAPHFDTGSLFQLLLNGQFQIEDKHQLPEGDLEKATFCSAIETFAGVSMSEDSEMTYDSLFSNLCVHTLPKVWSRYETYSGRRRADIAKHRTGLTVRWCLAQWPVDTLAIRDTQSSILYDVMVDPSTSMAYKSYIVKCVVDHLCRTQASIPVLSFHPETSLLHELVILIQQDPYDNIPTILERCILELQMDPGVLDIQGRTPLQIVSSWSRQRETMHTILSAERIKCPRTPQELHAQVAKFRARTIRCKNTIALEKVTRKFDHFLAACARHRPLSI
jgi:hypothetical protein